MICKGKQCRFGQICSGHGRCVCPQNCESTGTEICGSNRKTYRNKCEMMRDGCRNHIDLTIQHYGSCGQGIDLSCGQGIDLSCGHGIDGSCGQGIDGSCGQGIHRSCGQGIG